MKEHYFDFGNISRAVLFGASETLSRIIEGQHIDEILVMTGPRQAELITHTGETWKSFLKRRNIRCLFAETIQGNPELLEFITDETIGISSGCPYIFRKDVIERFHYKIINGHSSRLPQQRGGGGYSWMIMQGNRVGYAVWHLVDEGIDTGDIVSLEEFEYPASCQYPDDYLKEKSVHEYDLFKRIFTDIKSRKPFPLMAQSDHMGIYMPRLLTDVHGFIDWKWSNQDIERFAHAFDRPYKGASTFLMGKQVRVRNAMSVTFDGLFHPFQHGIIYRLFDNGVYVACRNGSLRCSLFSKNGIEPVEYNKRLIGERLYTPAQYLETAMRTRVEFLPKGPLIKEWQA
jgi:methionyl-tRNA formyltransferase